MIDGVAWPWLHALFAVAVVTESKRWPSTAFAVVSLAVVIVVVVGAASPAAAAEAARAAALV